MMKIPFNQPYLPPGSEDYLLESYRSYNHAGNNHWNSKCIDYLKEKFKFNEVFLVPSCTAALEMGLFLTGIKPGDEVILPSYTFSSTATAVLLTGAKPVFCEVDSKTMNIDINYLNNLITEKTRLIIPIDYAGIPCDITSINKIASKHNLEVFTDSAQSLSSRIPTGEFVGNASSLAAFSFHETKNFSCGEGGALVVNRDEWIDRAYIIQEKGTDRRKVIYGLKNKYEWVDIGSSYLLSDLLASVLYSQLQNIDFITNARAKVTNAYITALSCFEKEGLLNLPKPPRGSFINHHAFFIIFNKSKYRSEFIQTLKSEYNVNSYIGYQPLHSSKKGLELGYKEKDLPITQDLSLKIARLPLYTELGLSEDLLNYTVSSIVSVLNKIYK